MNLWLSKNIKRKKILAECYEKKKFMGNCDIYLLIFV
jgi:hypothetical protein